MHILWLVKTTLPQAAVACGLARASDVSGSWLTGQLAALRTHADLHLTVLSVGKTDASGAADGVDYRIVADAAAFAPLLQAGAFDLVHIWGTEYDAADAAQLANKMGARFVRPGMLSPADADALENSADVLVSLGNAYDNQMPSKLFGYFATGKPVLHLAVSESDPTLPYLARYPLALVLHAGEGVTPGVVAKLDKWLHDVKGKHLPFAEVAKLYPEFTPEKVAEAFLRGM